MKIHKKNISIIKKNINVNLPWNNPYIPATRAS